MATQPVPDARPQALGEPDGPATLILDGDQRFDLGALTAAETIIDTVDRANASARHAPSGQLQTGRRVLGRYEILQKLGSGAFGSVYAAQDALHPERDLALKFVSRRALADGLLELAQAEFTALSHLVHPNLAQAFDFERHCELGVPFFTMERVAGASIDYVPDRTPDALADIAVQVLRALHCIHNAGLVHRDIKPANILQQADGRVRVIDFGLVGARGAHAVVGTPGYMAPEAFRGVDATDHRSDLYSLGVSIVEIASGALRRSAVVLASMAAEHAALLGDIDALSALPVGMRGWLRQMCALHPADRFASANAAIDALNAAGHFAFAVETNASATAQVLSAPFIGRATALRTSIAFIRGATSGRWCGPERGLWLSGAPQVGKTRLARELELRAELDGLPVVRAEAPVEHDDWDPLRAALGQLRDHMADAGPMRSTVPSGVLDGLWRDADALIAQLVPQSAARPSELPMPARLLADNAAAVLIRMGQVFPFVLLVPELDDRHRTTAQVLVALVSRLAQSSTGPNLALVLASSGDGQAHEALRTSLGAHKDLLLDVPVRPLHRHEVGVLMRAMLGGRPVPDALVDVMVAETGGLPGLVEWLMQGMAGPGGLLQLDGHWHLPDIPADVARHLRSAFFARLDELAPLERRVLDVVAVATQPVDADLVGSALGLGADGVTAALMTLVRLRLLQRTVSGAVLYHVAQRRAQQTILDGMAPDGLATIHRHWAAAYADVSPQSLACLAHHYRHAGDTVEAARYLLAAGAQAHASAGAQTALGTYQEALALLPHDAVPERLAAREAIADVEVLLGEFDSALGHYTALQADVDVGHRHALDVKLGHLHMQAGNYPLAVRHLAGAEGLQSNPVVAGLQTAGAVFLHLWTRTFPRSPAPLPDRQHWATVSAAQFRLAQVYLFLSPSRMVQALLRAVEAGERAGDSAELANAYAFTAIVMSVLNRRDAAVSQIQRAQDVAARAQATEAMPRIQSYRALIDLCRLDFDSARDGFAAAERDLSRQGDLWELTAAISGQAAAQRLTGHLAEALDCCMRGADLMERVGGVGFVRVLLAQSTMQLAEMGRREEALAHLARCESASVQGMDALNDASVRLARGVMERVHGDLADACMTLEVATHRLRADDIRMDMAGEPFVLLPLCYLERRWLGVDMDPKLEQSALDAARRWTDGKPMHRVWYLAARGGYEVVAGQHVRAQATLEEARHVARRSGLATAEAEAELAIGRGWLRDPQRAAEGRRLVELAQASFTQVDALGLAARAQAALDHVAARVS